jgi:5'-nucleotidase
MQRIAIDMDGVLADVEAAFLQYHLKDTGIQLTKHDIKGKSEEENFPNVRKWVYTEGFFRQLPVMPHSQRVVQKLKERYDIFIVSAAVEFPQSMHEKHDWLKEHFPFISWRQMCFCGDKTIVKANIMIDDFFKNLDPFKGDISLLFTQAHNALADAGRHRRVYSWLDIEKILL